MDPRALNVIQVVMDALHSVGMTSPIQFAVFHLYHSTPNDRRGFIDSSLHPSGKSPFTCAIMDILSFPEADTKILSADVLLCRAMYPIIGRALHNEAESLQPFLRKPVAEFTPESVESFSFQRLGIMFKQNAPLTYFLLNNFVEQDDPNLDLSKPPSTNQTGDPKAHHNSKKAVMLTTVMCILNYARNRQSCIMQNNIGYFLAATKTGKRTISALNGIGVSCSFETVHRIQAKIALAAKANYRRHALTRPYVISYDNMNYMARTKTHLIHKTSHLQNDTAGYVYFQPGSTGGNLTRSVAIDIGKTESLKCTDFLPKDLLTYYRDAARSNVYKILKKYFPALKEAEKAHGQPFVHPVTPIHRLAVQKTEIYTLPTLELDEAKITDTIEIIKEFMKELDVKLESLNDSILMFKGDYLTVRNVGLAMFQRQDSTFINPSETFDFIEPVIGLFHLNMNVQQVYIENYWGRADGKDPGSLNRFVNLTRNTRITSDGKDFRACKSFLDDVLDAHVLAKFFHVTKAKDWSAFETLVAKACHGKKGNPIDWAKTVDNVVDTLFDASHIRELREESDDQRDFIRENAHLLMRDLLMGRDYEDAIRCGDSGRLLKIIEYWCVEYQGTSKSNYSSALIHLVACFKKLWKPEMLEHWLKNCLVNPSGLASGWMPDDLYGEYVIRENKARIDPSSNALTGGHNRTVHARQIMTYMASRQTMFRTTGATNYYQSSTLANSLSHVRQFADDLAGIFKLTNGRTTNSGRDKFKFYSAKDLYQDGMKAILTSVPIKKYMLRSRVNWTTYKPDFHDEDAPEVEDDMLAMEMNAQDDDILDSF